MRASQQRFADAYKDVTSALRLMPDNPRVLTTLGMIAAKLNRWQEATALFQKVARLQPDSADAHFNLGIAKADQFDLPAARDAFAEAVRLAPGHPAARYSLGRALFDLREYEAANPHLKEAVRLDPSNLDAIYLLAFTEKSLGRPAEAIPWFEKVQGQDPKHQEARFQLGQSYLQTGDTAKAVANWQKLIEQNPDHNEALYALSRAVNAADPVLAAEYRKRMVALQQARQKTDRAESLGNFGLSAAASRDWPRAIEQLKEALQVCGDCRAKADLHKNLGLIYARSGDLENAELELRAARKFKPGDAEIVRSLEMIRATRTPSQPGTSPGHTPR
jgi:tetratricopeptide (TPR) repeat protein